MSRTVQESITIRKDRNMNTTNTNGNGRLQRKTLATQLDRLDNTIDALADGINRAVADAVREGVTVAVQQAVQMVIREVLANPELLRQLVAQLAPPAPPLAAVVEPRPVEPSTLQKVIHSIGSRLSCCWLWLRTKTTNAMSWCWQQLRLVPSAFRSADRTLGTVGTWLWAWRKPLVISLIVGLLMGWMGYLSGPVVSSLALGVCSSAMSMVTYLLAPFVKLWRSFRTQEA
jgi:hypothetical protein